MLAAIYGCIKIFDSKPGLVIDAEGLIDNSSAAAAGRIPWTDIGGVNVFTMHRQRMLTIELRDCRNMSNAEAVSAVCSTAPTPS